MLNVAVVSFIMLSIVVLSVVAPTPLPTYKYQTNLKMESIRRSVSDEENLLYNVETRNIFFLLDFFRFFVLEKFYGVELSDLLLRPGL
jgi:hypothetical protein